jgi:hypothetical protein
MLYIFRKWVAVWEDGWLNAVMRVVCQIGKDATWFNIINSSFLKIQFFKIIHKYKERDSCNGAVKSEEVKMHRLHPGMPSLNCISISHNSEEDIHTSNRDTPGVLTRADILSQSEAISKISQPEMRSREREVYVHIFLPECRAQSCDDPRTT